MKTTRAQEKAVAYLEALIQDHRKREAWRLPTIRELADAAGVSPVSMRKAAGRLREEGILSVKHGAGIVIRQDAPAGMTAALGQSGPVAGPHLQKWEKLRRRLDEDIAEGAYAPGTQLPGIKELCVAYGACYKTMKKALENLEAAQRLTAYKKGYQVPALVPHGSTGRVALITITDLSGRMQRFSPRTIEILRCVENECSKRGVGLDFYAMAHDTGRLSPLGLPVSSPGPYDRRNATIASIVLAMGMPPPLLAVLVGQMEDFGKPAAVLDETGIPPNTFRYAPNSPLRVFSMANSPLCGETMGRYLLELGHRHVVYLSPYHNNTWSPQRLRGLQSVFGSAGPLRSVTAFTDQRFAHSWEFVDESADVIHVLEQALERSRNARVANPQTLQETIDAIGSRLGRFVQRVAPSHMVAPLLEQAQASAPQASAWVCCTDEVALAAVRFLRSRGRRVPQDISVAGFDDSPAAFDNGLTSLNFNIPAVVHAMVRYLMDSRLAATDFYRREFIEIEGFINKRATTGATRTQAARS